MRVFIAIGLPKEIKEKIAELEEGFTKYDLAFKWVKPENLHLTLKFLGNIDEEQIIKIKEAIAGVSGKFTSFEVNFDNFGFFPNGRKPRVFFISAAPEELLKSIAAELEEELETLGFEKESRFKSHITLARIKNPKNINLLKAKIKDTRIDKKFPINEITLYKSTLTKEGPVYEELTRSSLKNK